MLSCREFVKDADLLLAGDLSWPRKLSMRFHLLICHHCRRFVRQFKVLIGAIPSMYGKASGGEVKKVMDRIDSDQNCDLDSMF